MKVIKKILSLCSLLVYCFAASSTQYYFSATGNDGNTGTSPASPWQTIAKFNSFAFAPDDIASFNGGDFFIGAIVLNRNGTSGHPITVNSYGTGQAIISGFYTVPSWTLVSGGLYQATLPAGLSTMNMVTVDGVLQAMGRFPKIGAATQGYLTLQSSSGTASITSNAIAAAPSFVGGQIAIRSLHWIISRGTITAQNATTVSYTPFATPIGSPYNSTAGFGFFFQNHVNACTALGDWAYNGTTHVLTMFFGGGGPGAHVVKAASVDNLVTASSRSFVTINNMKLTGSNVRTVQLTSSNNIIISNCNIIDNGQDAIWTNASNTITLTSNTIDSTLNNGITGNSSTGFNLTGNTIRNSGTIPGMGVSGDGQYQGTAYIGGNSTITLNNVINSGYVGIHFVGVNTSISKNFVNGYCLVKDDGAGIYSWANGQAGSHVFNNIVINGTGNKNGTNDIVGAASGIYMDDNVTGVEIDHNTSALNAFSGMLIHNANNLNIHDNTFFNNASLAFTGGQAYYSNAANTIANINLNNNIFFSKNVLYDVTNVDPSNAAGVPWFTTANNNYYCRPLNETNPFSVHNTGGFIHTNLAGWRTQTGREANSKITPIAITDTNKIRFEYNATNTVAVVSLGGNNYMDVTGTVYTGTISLQPYTSAVLLQTTATNSLPIVNAGPDQTVTFPASVTMAGTASDPGGSIDHVVWTHTIGSGGTITNPASLTTTITGLPVGIHQFTLTAFDNLGAQNSDVVQITVNSPPNQPPTANAGPDRTITLPTNTISQTATGTDPEGGAVTFQWTQILGPSTATITNATQAQTNFNNLVQGTYNFQIKVTDNQNAFTTDNFALTVNAAPVPPVANAGSNQTITIPASANLDASGSTDADGTIVSYAWTKISGPAGGTITNAAIATTTVTGYTNPGNYVYQVLVTDNSGQTNSATVQKTVNAAPPPNQPPVVNAGGNKTLTLPTNSLTQVGSATDPDGTVASYTWTKISGPATFTIVSPNSSTTQITNLVQGTYIFQLQAIDNLGLPGTNQFTLTVNPRPNTAPIVSAGPDQTITLPINTTTLTATAASTNPGGSITTVQWTQIGGTASTITSSSTLSTGITGLTTPGSRTYKVLVTDNVGLTASDTVIVLVNPAPNQPPTSNAGPDRTIQLPTNSTTLAGSGTDPEAGTLTYTWTKISGPATFTITSATSASTTVTSLTQGVYQFNLKVTDNQNASANDQVTVTVNAANIPPTVTAGPNQTITLPTSTASLFSSGNDADGTTPTVLWVKVSGPAGGTITNSAAFNTAVTGYTNAGTYSYSATVTDNQGATATATMQVVVNASPPPNQPPVVNAGTNKTMTLPTNSVVQAGSATDADGTVVSYSWTKISGPVSITFTPSNASTTTITNLTQGTYILQLQATDNQGGIGTSTVTITVLPAPNLPPVVSAGPDQTLTLPTSSTSFNGSASDPEGGSVTTTWTFLSGPGPTPSITTPSSLTSPVTGMITAGSYSFKLSGTDGVNTRTDTMIILILPTPNVPPVVNAGADQIDTIPVTGTTIVTLSGTATDADGSIQGTVWSKVSGPAQGNITSVGALTTTFTNFTQGIYKFRLTATDNSGATTSDTVTITLVNDTLVSPQPTDPTAHAGQDYRPIICVFCSTVSVSVTGSGTPGTSPIVTYLWTLVSGPSTYTINSPNTASTVISGLKRGFYTFQFRVCDAGGHCSTDQMTIEVRKNHIVLRNGRIIVEDY